MRPEAPWCTLCYADLRAPVPTVPTVPTGPTFDPLTAPAAALGLRARDTAMTVSGQGADPTWPCAGCGAGNDFAAADCADCGEGFLAELRVSDGPLLELPVVGDFGALSRTQRLSAAVGVVLVVLVVFVLLGLLLS